MAAPVIEVEAKAWCRDPKAVRARLAAKGAKLLHREREEDLYWQHPCRDLAARDEALRTRVRRPVDPETGSPKAAPGPPKVAAAAPDAGRVTLTWKGPKLDARTKSRREVNVTVPAREARELLLGLGFQPVARVAKVRETYGIGLIVLTLDAVEDLGFFVEAEIVLDDEKEPDAKAAFDRDRAAVEALLTELGLRDLERRSYLELLLERGAGRLPAGGS